MFGYKYTVNLSDSQIEEKARDLGMIYERAERERERVKRE